MHTIFRIHGRNPLPKRLTFQAKTGTSNIRIVTIGIGTLGYRNVKQRTSTVQRNSGVDAMHRASLPWKLNTSNPAKMADFEQLFSSFGFAKPKSTQHDLREIQADPIQVVAHKASQLENYTLVEDTSLHIQGEQVGIQIRWLIDQLPTHRGKPAEMVTLMAYREEEKIYVYQGVVPGKIVDPRGPHIQGFEINPYFQPDAQAETLAEFVSHKTNPRYLAFEKFVQHKPYTIQPIITQWQGTWQQDKHA